MLEVAETRRDEASIAEMKEMCSDLFNEWLADLNFEEKQIWLWNAFVEMLKIRQRRK